ncbi:MAG: hypothetical protein JRN15_09350 [Nitrososphaerota archaeon]|nr:hypothetical protein [Nitrososphaerota archaeon]
MTEPDNTIILEEASLETVPKKYLQDKNCKEIERKFGVTPEFQILDANFHHPILSKLGNPQKRGRPDVVHFALLDITSTPLYMKDKVRVVIHTVSHDTIILGKQVRVPRTLQRFCGVISKVLSERQTQFEKQHFELTKNQSLRGLITSLGTDTTIAFSIQGIPTDVSSLISQSRSEKTRVAWVVGGFAHGHFDESSRSVFDRIVSISDASLPAHVVTSRLSYELEKLLVT